MERACSQDDIGKVQGYSSAIKDFFELSNVIKQQENPKMDFGAKKILKDRYGLTDSQLEKLV